MESSVKVYVRVKADFGIDGIMIPREITWEDGRSFHIDEVTRIARGTSYQTRDGGDCYTVVIHGNLRYLHFERCSTPSGAYQGRWWVECRRYA